MGTTVRRVPLLDCPECGNQVSEYANACPQCGYPLREPERTEPRCPYCGKAALERAHGLYGAKEIIIGLILTALLILPGVLYYFDTTRALRCAACGKRVRKPL